MNLSTFIILVILAVIIGAVVRIMICLLYTSDAADD